jgi:hypothetical protein
MVIGVIIDWAVYRTLDLAAYSVWWLTKKTGEGIYYTGKYLATYGTQQVGETPVQHDDLPTQKTI